MREKKRVKAPEENKNKSEEQSSGEERRRAERLREDNEITITIVSGGKDLPQEKIIYNYTKDISAGGARIQANIFLPVNALLKIDLILKNLRQRKSWSGKTGQAHK